MNAELETVAERLRTQDNRITANPIFVVQQRIRDYGMDPTWADGTAWLGDEGREVPEGTPEAVETGYRDRWEFVQPFFTEAAAEAYIKANQHNLKECQVYVASGYRNREWAMVREMLLACNKLEGRCQRERSPCPTSGSCVATAKAVGSSTTTGDPLAKWRRPNDGPPEPEPPQPQLYLAVPVCQERQRLHPRALSRLVGFGVVQDCMRLPLPHQGRWESMTECQHPHLDGMEYKDGHKREECSQCGRAWSTRQGDQLLNGEHAQEYCPDLQAMNPGPGPWMKPWPCPSCITEPENPDEADGKVR